ncbi:hypothetical protein OTK49_02720 [Vibrio coralliirubri]|uniref:peptidyl-tRNA hydrolase n=1 Tax=Vibrio coralliirubri TaxID=1516159 RepID=UPI0022849FB6|nr:hypothetical protein [Vibrio coralliirubri]
MVRKDLEMSAGKLSAQSGHAYDDSIRNAQDTHPELCTEYRDGINGGSKVTLEAKSVNALIKAYNQARLEGLPCSIVVDQNHIMLPHFTGEPIITAVGIGPVTKSQSKFLKKFRCVK